MKHGRPGTYRDEAGGYQVQIARRQVQRTDQACSCYVRAECWMTFVDLLDSLVFQDPCHCSVQEGAKASVLSVPIDSVVS
jgi:hypothetical protein